MKGDARGEYGSIPYVTGHSTGLDASLLWINSADTWTDILDMGNEKMMSNFVSESGQLELFIFGSKSPKT
jgi:alpha-glucosidase (family GH31 glycosyl hydrolase)